MRPKLAPPTTHPQKITKLGLYVCSPRFGGWGEVMNLAFIVAPKCLEVLDLIIKEFLVRHVLKRMWAQQDK